VMKRKMLKIAQEPAAPPLEPPADATPVSQGGPEWENWLPILIGGGLGGGLGAVINWLRGKSDISTPLLLAVLGGLTGGLSKKNTPVYRLGEEAVKKVRDLLHGSGEASSVLESTRDFLGAAGRNLSTVWSTLKHYASPVPVGSAIGGFAYGAFKGKNLADRGFLESQRVQNELRRVFEEANRASGMRVGRTAGADKIKSIARPVDAKSLSKKLRRSRIFHGTVGGLKGAFSGYIIGAVLDQLLGLLGAGRGAATPSQRKAYE